MSVEHNDKGEEVVDTRPLKIPVHFMNKGDPLRAQVREMIRREMSEYARSQGEETFEEADDFEVGDDYDPRSPYEMDFDQEMAALEKGEKDLIEETPSFRGDKTKDESGGAVEAPQPRKDVLPKAKASSQAVGEDEAQ